MPEGSLRDLHLDQDQVARAASFLEAYAETANAELVRGMPAPQGRGETRALKSKQHSGPVQFRYEHEPLFTLAADTASAFRDAAQWLIYLDVARARKTLARAARVFISMGQPYGMYLLAVAGEWATDPMYEILGDALAGLHLISSGGDTRQMLMPALLHPQQQAYLLLAAGGSQAIPRDSEAPWLLAMEESPHARGVVPVGSLGTPIRRLWDVARQLFLGVPDVSVIGRHLAEMSRAYAETIELAQVNDHLWRHAAAPVDVGDLDIAGIAALTARLVGADGLRDAVLGSVEGRLAAVALAPIEAGIALASDERRGQ